MGIELHKLTARKVGTISEAGYYADGGGLYLQVTAGGAKSWIFRYRFEGKRPEMGLGPTHTVSLAEAREAAQAARKQVLAGHDPLAGRRTAKAKAVATPTFWEAAQAYIAERKAGWKNAKHADQWTNTLKTYAKPFIGSKRVDRIETEDVLAVLRPIWATKTETATRVRQRVECILDAVTVQKHRSGDNPARWKGHLAMILPKPTTVTKVENFPSLPYSQVVEFMAALRQRVGESARALEFTILTAARTGMVTGAIPAELDAKCINWTVPADRMKAKKEHVVPLSHAAQLLAKPRRSRGLLFPNDATGEQLSENAMLALLNRMGYGHVTVHGFRATFKTWADEIGEYPDDLSEAALAHAIKDKSKAAYKRGTMLERRREMMEAWAAFCGY